MKKLQRLVLTTSLMLLLCVSNLAADGTLGTGSDKTSSPLPAQSTQISQTSDEVGVADESELELIYEAGKFIVLDLLRLF